MTRTYLSWESVEQIPADEAATIAKVVEQINFIQGAQACPRGGHHVAPDPYTFTGTHAKTHGIVKGVMKVSDDVPAAFKQSMFAKAGTYSMIMRYSSEPGVPNLDDRVPQPRGLGIKVFGVEGTKLDGKINNTQDFEFNSCNILELGSAQTAFEIIGLRIKHGDPAALSNSLDERSDGPIQQLRCQIPNQRVESQTQHSQSAYRFGDYVAKFSFVATGELQRQAAEELVSPEHSSSVLREWLHEYYRKNVGTYELRAQLCENLEEQPVEDSRYAWDAEKYPFVTIATITIPAQETCSPARLDAWGNIRVDVWNGLETLKPLGSINRVRRSVYPASFAFRHDANKHQEFVPKSLEDIP